MSRPQLFFDLYSFAASLQRRQFTATIWHELFDDVGLIFTTSDQSWEYWCTPKNSDTFATTGGDGVHFGFLRVEGRSPDDFPVVMSVPANSDPANIIVGENLHEFLCLGCTFGYFSLEQLAYDFDATVLAIQSGRYEDESNPYASEIRRVLAQLSTRFALKPWPNVRDRLRQLQSTWLPALDVPDFDTWLREHPYP